ncbi:MAG TPA: ribosome-binding factor A [Candidatus Paceibacterota bacterium]|nr:ribosome-binding factor A [Candidatus Paceibacterota bacterium]
MGNIHDKKVATVLTEQAAKYIAREAGRETLITPTRSDVSRDGKNATIYVSVFPDAQKDHALAFLKRHKDLFRDSLKKGTRLSRLPYITFEFDYGEQNRQHLDELSKQIEDGAAD